MDERYPPRMCGPRLRRVAAVGAFAVALSVAQTVSAGTTGGSALALAAEVELVFDAPPIDVFGATQQLAVGPNPGSQSVAGSIDFSDLVSSSSVVATSTTVAVTRSPVGLEATSTVDGLQLTLRGTTVLSATTIVGGAICPANSTAVVTEAQANGLRLGDAAPVNLAAGGPDALGSTTITDEDGRNYTVDIVASAFAESESDGGEARGLRLQLTIGNQAPVAASLAIANCDRPDGGAAAPGPEQPDGGLAESGTDTAMVAALLGIVLVAGGGSALLWARGRRSPRTDPC